MSAIRWMLAPVWAAQIFSGTKSFSNPIIGSERLNRRGFHVWRAKLAHDMADRRRQRLAHLVSAEDREAFARDGYVEKRDFIPADRLPQVLAELRGLVVEAREMKEGDAVTRRIPLSPETLKKMPALAEALNSPVWYGLTRYVASFEVAPVVYIQTVLTQVGQGGKVDPQTAMHMDTFHPTMKAWLFLEDVDDAMGPFTYVPGSHRYSPERQAWEKEMSIRASAPQAGKGGAFRLSAEDRQRLGFREPIKFAVPKNTLVVGDTCGFHARGVSSRPSVRIELYAYSRRNPFVPWTGLDIWSLPGLKGRQAPLFYWVLDMAEKLGLGRNQWKRNGPITPVSEKTAWSAR